MAKRPDTSNPLKRRLTSALSWLRHRFGYDPFARHVIYHRVTKTPWYYGGGSALLLLFLVLMATGIFLGLEYSPSPDTARASIIRITKTTTLGWFVRGLHYWSAGMMLVMLMHHVLRQVLFGGYKPPREGLWLVGCGLFVLIIVNGFIGYTLRWDESGVTAIRVATSMFYQVPAIGEHLATIVQGGWEIGVRTLSRLYAVHVLFVPLAISALIGFHLYLLILHGETTVAERKFPVETAEQQKLRRDALKKSEHHGHEFFPFTAAKSISFASLILLIVVTMTLLFGPPDPGPAFDIHVSPVDQLPKEEWWFAWVSGLIALLPPAVAPTFYVLFPACVVLLMLLLPFVDRGANTGARHRPLAVIFVITVVVAILALTGYRIRSPFLAWPTDEVAPIPPGVQLTTSTDRGRLLFTEYGCHDCHAVGGHGARFGPNLSALGTRLSPEELGRYILEPPAGVPMPAYRDRVSPEDLRHLVDFVLVAQTFPRSFEGSGHE